MQKNRILLLAIFLGISYASLAQIKPTLMVMPANAWMTANGYTQEFNNQGTTDVVYLYDKALREHFNMGENQSIISHQKKAHNYYPLFSIWHYDKDRNSRYGNMY